MISNLNWTPCVEKKKKKKKSVPHFLIVQVKPFYGSTGTWEETCLDWYVQLKRQPDTRPRIITCGCVSEMCGRVSWYLSLVKSYNTRPRIFHRQFSRRKWNIQLRVFIILVFQFFKKAVFLDFFRFKGTHLFETLRSLLVEISYSRICKFQCSFYIL